MNSNHFQNIFNDLAVNGIETSSLLSWSFFFFSKKKNYLKQVVNELDGYGYLTEISKFDNEYRLIATKVEILTPQKLEKRNIAFAELANHCNVLFDGWEVSKTSCSP